MADRAAGVHEPGRGASPQAAGSIVERVAAALQDDERWRVIVRGNAWLCPYCLRIGARNLRPDEPIEEEVAGHFARGCPAFDGFKADAQPIEAVRQTARFVVFKTRVLRWLQDDRRFRIVDKAGRWLCPFCATPTEATAPRGRSLEDASAWGPAPEEDPFLGQVVGHLLRCSTFAEGEDRARPLDELEQAAARGASAKRHDDIKTRFASEPSFRLMDQERRWLCPFCAVAQDVHLEERPNDAFFRGIAAHLEGCKAHGVLGGRPRPVEELKARIQEGAKARQLQKVRGKVERHALWRVRDVAGAWVCPYCATATGIDFPERGPSGEREPAALDRFVGCALVHLAACEDYKKPGAQVRDRRELADAVAAQNESHDKHRRARRALVEDPRFGVTDAFQSWVCPYCLKNQKSIHIDPSRDSALFEKTVEAVAAHLVQGACPAWREGEPASTLTDVEEAARRTALKASGLREVGVRRVERAAAESQDEQSWRRIKEDLEAVRTRVERAKQRESSLKQARHNQLRLLPEVPEVAGLEFARLYKPCDAVGGDFYAFFKATDDAYAFAIGDISGHGIEAALLMGLAKKLLEVHGRGRASSAQTLALSNRDIFADLDERTFVTVLYGLIDASARRLTLSRAGHDPLVLYNPKRRPPLSVLDAKGMALGMDAGPVFEQTLEELEVPLRAGDLLIAYTDGVTETMNAAREQFGPDRLHAVVEEHGRHEAEYVLWQIERALDAFRGGLPRTDDLTLVAVKVREA
jgi:serine phosphatase RsbU (regulator of sigma subunit)